MKNSPDVRDQVRQILDSAVEPRPTRRCRCSQRKSEAIRDRLVVAELVAIPVILVSLAGIALETFARISPHTTDLVSLYFIFLGVTAFVILALVARSR